MRDPRRATSTLGIQNEASAVLALYRTGPTRTRVRDVPWRGGKREWAYLGLRDDLFFTRVCVSTVDDADDVRLCALHQRDRGPEHTLSATTCIAVRSV